MMLPLAALALGSQLAFGSPPITAVADSPPNLAVDQNCRTQAKHTDSLGGGKDVFDSSVASCMRSEHTARDKLRSEWTQFTPATRERCTATSTMGGMPSYVELLTCLEMDKQARELEQRQRTTGQRKD